MTALIVFLAMVVLLMLRVPVAFAMMIPAVGYLLVTGQSLGLVRPGRRRRS